MSDDTDDILSGDYDTPVASEELLDLLEEERDGFDEDVASAWEDIEGILDDFGVSVNLSNFDTYNA